MISKETVVFTVERGVVKFNFADFLSIFKAMMMMVGMRSP
jgi:hypothetical protein